MSEPTTASAEAVPAQVKPPTTTPADLKPRRPGQPRQGGKFAPKTSAAVATSSTTSDPAQPGKAPGWLVAVLAVVAVAAVGGGAFAAFKFTHQ